MALQIVVEDNRFRVEWQGYSIGWLPDTICNRKAILVFLRLLQDENGKTVFTFGELSVLFGGARQPVVMLSDSGNSVLQEAMWLFHSS